jgi:hypothetical protein
MQAVSIGRYPQGTETTVYFCALEALQNIAKYASASQATIRLACPGSSLQFSITDHGDGFDTSRARPGSSLQGMADRLAALGGTFRLGSRPGRDHRNRAAAGTCSGQLTATAACQEIPESESARSSRRECSSMMRMMPDGAKIAYRRQGDGPGTVLVHGGFIDSSSWTGLMEVLARTRTVVAADRRGHGDSDPYTSSYRLSDDVDDLVAIVTDLAAEAGEVELVAVSAGCHVALAAAVAGAPAARVVSGSPRTSRPLRSVPTYMAGWTGPPPTAIASYWSGCC